MSGITKSPGIIGAGAGYGLPPSGRAAINRSLNLFFNLMRMSCIEGAVVAANFPTLGSIIASTIFCPVNGPNVPVPPDCSVYIRASNGLGNETVCVVGMSPEEVNFGVTYDIATQQFVAAGPTYFGGVTSRAVTSNRGNVLTPNTEISFPVDNLNQIWAVGFPGNSATDAAVLSALGIPILTIANGGVAAGQVVMGAPPDGIIISIRASGT